MWAMREQKLQFALIDQRLKFQELLFVVQVWFLFHPLPVAFWGLMIFFLKRMLKGAEIGKAGLNGN